MWPVSTLSIRLQYYQTTEFINESGILVGVIHSKSGLMAPTFERSVGLLSTFFYLLSAPFGSFCQLCNLENCHRCCLSSSRSPSVVVGRSVDVSMYLCVIVQLLMFVFGNLKVRMGLLKPPIILFDNLQIQ